ncbi:MAG TPA: ParB/RepB/Spo0J family partition protein [Blastocatellia bacterium]|nr:ParB/RepB/Spo0J family partition protein [Blastocatellia bacterium]
MSGKQRGLPATLKMRHDRHYVEELASRSGAPVGRMIAIDRLEPNPQQPRIEIGDLTELVASIREKGVLEPLLVRPSEVGGRFMIISGERRYRAAREAGLRELPCIEMEVDDRAVAEIALIENLQRKDLTPFEEADGFAMLVERFGYTHEEVARKIGKSRSSVTEVLSIASLPSDVREQCRRADISSKSLLLQIARQPDDEAMRAFVRRIVEQGMTRDEARRARSVKQARPQPYVFRHQPETKEFTLELKFRRSAVNRDEVIAVLERLLAELREKDQTDQMLSG